MYVNVPLTSLNHVTFLLHGDSNIQGSMMQPCLDPKNCPTRTCKSHFSKLSHGEVKNLLGWSGKESGGLSLVYHKPAIFCPGFCCWWNTWNMMFKVYFHLWSGLVHTSDKWTKHPLKIRPPIDSRWVITCGYGSIPINTIFRGLFTSIYQLFWCEQKRGTWFWPIPML